MYGKKYGITVIVINSADAHLVKCKKKTGRKTNGKVSF